MHPSTEAAIWLQLPGMCPFPSATTNKFLWFALQSFCLPWVYQMVVRWAQLVRAGYKRLWVPSPYGPFTQARLNDPCESFQHRIFCGSEIHFHTTSRETALLLLRHRDTVKAGNHHMDCLFFHVMKGRSGWKLKIWRQGRSHSKSQSSAAL